jgi:hypothetical protein
MYGLVQAEDNIISLGEGSRRVAYLARRAVDPELSSAIAISTRSM